MQLTVRAAGRTSIVDATVNSSSSAVEDSSSIEAVESIVYAGLFEMEAVAAY